MDPEEIEEKFASLTREVKELKSKADPFDKSQLKFPLDNQTQKIIKDYISSEILDVAWNDYFYYHTFFESLDGWNPGATTLSKFGTDGNLAVIIDIASGAGVSSESIDKTPAISDLLSYDKRQRTRTYVAYFDDANQNSYIGIGQAFTGNTKGYGFEQANAALKAVSADGTATTTKTLNVTLDTSKFYKLETVLYPGERIDFFLDGVLATTINENIPSGAMPRFITAWIQKSSADGLEKNISLSEFEFIMSQI